MCLKNNKATDPDGLLVELLKNGCNELVGRIHQRLKPLSSPEKVIPFDMRQLQGYKPYPYRI